jgi:hypothetical protein
MHTKSRSGNLKGRDHSEGNIRMDLSEIGWDWIYLARDRDQWRALVSTVMKFWVL